MTRFELTLCLIFLLRLFKRLMRFFLHLARICKGRRKKKNKRREHVELGGRRQGKGKASSSWKGEAAEVQVLRRGHADVATRRPNGEGSPATTSTDGFRGEGSIWPGW